MVRKTSSNDRSPGPYTTGGRTTVMGTAAAYVAATRSPASLLRPYSETGEGGSLSTCGCPGADGPQAASEETTIRTGGRVSEAQPAAMASTPSRLTRMKSETRRARTQPAR